MMKDRVLRLIHDHKSELKKHDVESIYLFGSVARDEEGPQSDIDLLVNFGGPTTFDKYMDLKLYLEDLLQKKVDLVTEAALRPELRDFIMQGLIRAA